MLSHTQKGNNNAYCQDNDISWLNWENNETKQDFREWLAGMVAARQTYMVPFIRAFSGENRNNNRIAWRRVDGKPMEMDDWNRLSSVALHIGIGSDGPEMLYLINQTNAPARFVLPKDRQQDWRLICDTNMRHAQHGHAEGEVLQLPVSMSILHYQPKKKSA
ncbi:glycogen operon protein GlgX [Vibrio cholerae]|nr:glycogen operon protein GlgX [Vibrio cholerae]CSA31776.1 glycogen operon protein GlgX [Vibrio cholerae]CSB34195.1 glycogen operon protein GlgX [Vibrio cholerae]CSB35635.1 glycogen operon protein GlgX [Vibrio cholerae]CSB49427.1 glycogen operon protein GlgX [Vibrio cholerae]